MEKHVPRRYREFLERFPKLGEAWELTRQGSTGPLATETLHLVKLGIAIGALREGAVRSAVRKARGAGVCREAIEQVIALATSTVGFPGAVAAFSWAMDGLSGEAAAESADRTE